MANAGSVVLRDDLMNLVWPGAVVEEGNLTVRPDDLKGVEMLRQELLEGKIAAKCCGVNRIGSLG